MVRRLSTTIAALAVALAIYGTFVHLIAVRIDRMIHGDLPRRRVALSGATPDNCVSIFGVPVPYEVLIQAALLVVALFVFEHFKQRVCRRHRFLRDECVECGRPIESWHGRCPGCGVRIGPDAPGRYTLRRHG